MTSCPLELYYVCLHISTTLSGTSTSNNNNGNYSIIPERNEISGIAWNAVSASSLETIATESVSIKTNTACEMENDQNSPTVSLKDAVSLLDLFIQTHISSKSADYIFVTYDAWDLRVVLPREARDQNVVLPAYLQHSRCFALKKEYLKWQVHHPETLSYTVGNMGNVLTALEVKLDYPFNYGNVGVLAKTGSQEVDILSRLLVQLIKKSKPSEEHPDVLTRPFDSKLDIRCFLSERSKVLHLSNLPYDTTQSELESWFTSYGGRPIAFWTLKTPDQHKPTGTGFVVFSTHEEAAEALGMNGRYLNEKPIEIQPSSARILDRAQEILTAFPQSKNRPRPGDWNCPSCGFSNFQRRTACFRCLFPASSAVAIQEQIQPFNNGNNNNSMSHGQQQQQQQQIQTQPVLQQQNHHHINQNQNYNNGQNKKQNMNHMQHNNSNNINNNSSNQHHSNPNQQHLSSNNQTSNNNNNRSVPFRAGDWKCPSETCQYHNFAKNVTCLRCGGTRVGGSSATNTNATSNVSTSAVGSGISSPQLQHQQNQHHGHGNLQQQHQQQF